MTMDETRWKMLRRRNWSYLGMTRPLSRWLADLEWGNPDRCIRSLKELTKVAAWPGRVIRRAMGSDMKVNEEGRWESTNCKH